MILPVYSSTRGREEKDMLEKNSARDLQSPYNEYTVCTNRFRPVHYHPDGRVKNGGYPDNFNIGACRFPWQPLHNLECGADCFPSERGEPRDTYFHREPPSTASPDGRSFPKRTNHALPAAPKAAAVKKFAAGPAIHRNAPPNAATDTTISLSR